MSSYYDQYHVGYASFFQCPESMCRYPQCTVMGRPLSLPQRCVFFRPTRSLNMAPVSEKKACAVKYLYKV